MQRRDAPDPATFVGRGKAEEIAALSRSLDADTVVFDDELTPAQHRNLEKLFGRTAIDRTAVILDIFAQNARSPEGKAQVELALLALPAAPSARPGHGAEPAGGRHRDPGTGRDAARGRPPPPRAPHAQAGGRAARGRAHAVAAAPQPRPGPPSRAGAGRLHQRREVDAAQPADRRRRAGGEPPLRHARPAHPPALASRRRDGARDRHGRLRAQAARTSWSRRSAPRSTRCAWPTWSCTWSTARRSNAEGQMAAVREVLDEIGAADVPELVVVNKADGAPEEAKALAHAHRGLRARLGPHRRGGRRAPAGPRRPPARARTGSCSSSCPGRAATCWPPSTARVRWWARRDGEESATLQVVLDDVGRARFAEFVAAP